MATGGSPDGGASAHWLLSNDLTLTLGENRPSIIRIVATGGPSPTYGVCRPYKDLRATEVTAGGPVLDPLGGARSDFAEGKVMGLGKDRSPPAEDPIRGWRWECCQAPSAFRQRSSRVSALLEGDA
jgi:hypothetical protein